MREGEGLKPVTIHTDSGGHLVKIIQAVRKHMTHDHASEAIPLLVHIHAHPSAPSAGVVGEYSPHQSSSAMFGQTPDRKSVVQGKGVSERVDLGGRRHIKKQKKKY